MHRHNDHGSIHLPRDNFLIDLDWLVSKEGRIASCHLINKDTKSPPIYCSVVSLKKEKKQKNNCNYSFLATKNTNSIHFLSNTEKKDLHFTFDRMISGARYSGVPQSVHVRPLTFLAKPKSVTLM